MKDFSKYFNICYKQKWNEKEDGDIANISNAEALFWILQFGDFLLFGERGTGKGGLINREDLDQIPDNWYEYQKLIIPFDKLKNYEAIVHIVNPDYLTRFSLLHNRTQRMLIEWYKAIYGVCDEDSVKIISGWIERQFCGLCFGLVVTAVIFYEPTTLRDIYGNIYTQKGLLGLQKRFFSDNEMTEMLEKYDKKMSYLNNTINHGRKRASTIRILPDMMEDIDKIKEKIEDYS
jgi:hypothetical protein